MATLLDPTDRPPVTMRDLGDLLACRARPDDLSNEILIDLAQWSAREERRAWEHFNAASSNGLTGAPLRAINDRMVRIEKLRVACTLVADGRGLRTAS